MKKFIYLLAIITLFTACSSCEKNDWEGKGHPGENWITENWISEYDINLGKGIFGDSIAEIRFYTGNDVETILFNKVTGSTIVKGNRLMSIPLGEIAPNRYNHGPYEAHRFKMTNGDYKNGTVKIYQYTYHKLHEKVFAVIDSMRKYKLKRVEIRK